MLLSDLSSLRKVLRNSSVTSADHTRYNDQVDLDIERMYTESPQVSEWPVVYNFDRFYTVEKEEPTSSDSKPLSSFWSASTEFAVPDFSCKPIELAPRKVTTSTLTKLLDESLSKRAVGKAKPNGIPLTVYLPDYTSLKVYVKEKCTFGELIKQVLAEHKQQGLHPPLDYDEPENYEVRIHEGDGEPDRDFQAFELDKTLKQYDIDECCLCLIEDRGGAYFESGASRFSSNPFQSIDMSGRSAPAVHRDRRDSSTSNLGDLIKGGSSGYIQDVSSKRLEARDFVDFAASSKTDDPRARYQSEDADPDTVTIRFPNGQQVSVPVDENTTLRDLLPLITKLHPLTKLRLYTDEYIFVISSQDQKRLQYSSPKMDMSSKISTIGTTFYELQKKTYADSMRATKVKTVTTETSGTRVTDLDHIVITEATANAYQEWNVVKKNRFGRKQERIFGVDGKKVYNGKRGTLGKGGTAQRVQRAERDISSIVNIEILSSDDKTFRITWRDDRDLYDIEYTFDTSRECAEAVAKIRYIRKRIALDGRNNSAKR